MKAPVLQAITVHAYCGSSAEEEPRRVQWKGQQEDIVEILDRWRGPEGRWFRVRLEHGATLRLLCTEPERIWHVAR